MRVSDGIVLHVKNSNLKESDIVRSEKVVRVFSFSYSGGSAWRGSIPSKKLVLERVYFSLTSEYVRGARGYITEKIFDTFCAGNMLVYWGKEDIKDYISPDYFIDIMRFDSLAELYEYLRTMLEERFLECQQTIQSFLASDAAQQFSIVHFARIMSKGISSSLGHQRYDA